MGTFGDDGILPNTKSESEEPEQGFSSTDSHIEDALLEKLENVVLKADEYDTENDGQKDSGCLDGSGLLPLRPYAGDCLHFIRTGSCKFGLDCRYNHPDIRTQTQTQAAIDLDKDVVPEDSGPIECKYYRTAEGCKYGKSCRYWHHGEESQNIVPELNFLGLPIRSGEKECPFYMRNGTCGYGSRCVFNHPDPTPITGMGSPNSSVDDKYERQLSHPLEKHNGLPIHFSGASQPDQTSRFLYSFSDNTISYPNSHSSYVTPHTPPQQMQKQSEWNGYQAPNSHQSGNYSATPSADGSLRKSYISMQDEEFPERPGRPDCDYFMKTGNCKFRSACRYHHPKDRKPKPDERVLSEKGLPLRPGRSICRHYERHGDCKFGSACLFDHPISHGLSAYTDWHVSKTSADSDAGSWGD
ncbi:zinc finger CCCH domain-containing protein 67-like [Olea europaea var. sylvestris]|uniref:zinc finger CCCH domain-containing protein 67-like n=1 Tax=Olea europaea var. sylvestris TaxID=158386 RepID=UPI000C1D6D77|nr:zinc finger CCCH domain-containing protein 67-like [Olea europaea var. sylvestris]